MPVKRLGKRTAKRDEAAYRSDGWNGSFLWMNHIGCAESVPPGRLCRRPATDGTRGRILLAGLALFAEHGFHGTSIRDIAAGADVQSRCTATSRRKRQSSPSWSWPATKSTTPAW